MNKSALRVVFMGTPEFAVPSLRALVEANWNVVGVFTQPDRPVGRGHKVAFSPVKQFALERELPVYQFERVSRQEGLDQMRALKPDLVVTAAFGQILSRKLLAVPQLGTVNVHASLLPRHRGAAPIAWAIMMGETTTGVTTMLTNAGLDTGDMLLRRETAIQPDETTAMLSERLSHLGAELLIETLDKLIAGEIEPIPQQESESTYEPMLEKEMGRIDWKREAAQIECQIRGLNPWPCAFTTSEQGAVKIYAAAVKPAIEGHKPGEVCIASARDGLVIACGSGALEILEMQIPGGKRMSARAYLAGKKIPEGTIFGNVEDA